MQKIKIKAFTLIELLVVIAIIGILSALIVVGMSSTTQKATIAKAQVFSNSLRNSLMGNLVSEWKLDGGIIGNNAVAIDIFDSWNTNNASTVGTANPLGPVILGGTNCVNGNCLQFDGTDDFVNFGNKTNLHFASNFTIEAWVNIPSVPVHIDCMILGDYNGTYKGYKFSIGLNRKVYMLVGRQSDSTAAQVESSQQLDLNKWYHVAASYDGRANVFLNGLRTRATSDYAPIEAEVANILIGKAQWYAQYFKGTIDNVRVYNIAVPTSQIQQTYFAGLNKLFAKQNIDNAEYQQRIASLRQSVGVGEPN